MFFPSYDYEKYFHEYSAVVSTVRVKRKKREREVAAKIKILIQTVNSFTLD